MPGEAVRRGYEQGGRRRPDELGGRRTSLVFSRQNHLLGDHPITRGRDDSERVNKVQTFTGTSLKGPEGSVPILKLADTAVDYSFDDEQRSRPPDAPRAWPSPSARAGSS